MPYDVIWFYIFYWGKMCIFKIVKPLSMYVLKILYIINYNKQITTLQNMLLAVYLKKQREKFSFPIGSGIKSMCILLLAFQVVLIAVTTGNIGSRLSCPNRSRARRPPHLPSLVQLPLSWNTNRAAIGLHRHCVQCDSTHPTPDFKKPGPSLFVGNIFSMTGSYI